MKILVVSDSHGRNTNLIEIVKKVSPIDMMIHLGDFCGTATAIENMVKCPVHMVAGNNDYSSTYPREKVITIGKHRIFMTHGHQYMVNYGTDRIVYKAMENNADILMFGHTHVPLVKYEDGITIVNPGSVSLSREYPFYPSYVIMEIDRHEEVLFGINYLKR